MVKLGRTKHEDRERSAKYQSIGRALHTTARDLALIGEAKYGNGLAIVAIHSAIIPMQTRYVGCGAFWRRRAMRLTVATTTRWKMAALYWRS